MPFCVSRVGEGGALAVKAFFQRGELACFAGEDLAEALGAILSACLHGEIETVKIAKAGNYLSLQRTQRVLAPTLHLTGRFLLEISFLIRGLRERWLHRHTLSIDSSLETATTQADRRASAHNK